MAFPVLPSPDNFLAVALVINRSRDGPRFVFHYPPCVLPPQNSSGRVEASDEYGFDEDEDPPPGRSSRFGSGPFGPQATADLQQWNHDDHLITESGTQIVPWEHVAGFPTKDLENILTPARAYHKRLFQVSLDPLHCVSYPIYVPENGIWRKKKKQQQQQQQQKQDMQSIKKDDEDTLSADPDKLGPSGQEKGPSDADQTDVKDMAKPVTKSGDETEDKKSSMTMFNLVFFLNPKEHEVKDLIDIMHSHIIKKVNKAYKYCQERSDFVWKESKRILALKDKGREDKRKMSLLWDEILATSSLAASMQDIYDAVSRNKIAALQLETVAGMVTHSVQIPLPFHVSDLPMDGDNNQCGLWLTTANSSIGDDAPDDPDYLDKNFALLLMADEKKIINELSTDPDETTQGMIEFVRRCKPTLSFYQVAQQSSTVLTPAQVRKFAQHFIFWRRAIAIPPLHARDMYIVSPNCDLRRLPQAAAQWARQFPLSPPLPNFLAELSIAPRPYKLHCPSKAHRPIYMAMLAWLMRGGWVTQLCTFAYVVVWPEIVYEVEYELEKEDIARAKNAQNKGRESSSAESSSSATSAGFAGLGDGPVAGFGTDFLPLLDDNGSDLFSSTATIRDLSLSHSQSFGSRGGGSVLSGTTAATQQQQGQPSPSSPIPLTSPTSPTTTATSSTTPHRQLPHRPDTLSRTTSEETSASEPTMAEQAAEKARLERIADKAARELAERAMAHARKAVPQQTAHPSINHAPHLLGMTPHIILDAKKATGKESLYLSAIGRRLRDRAATKSKGAGSGPSQQDNKDDSNSGVAAAHNHKQEGPGKDAITMNQNNDSKALGGTSSSTRPAQGGVVVTTNGTTATTTNNNNNNTRDGNWDERVANAWPQFWKYFNGRSALERIALQEDMKRKEAWNLLTAMSEYLLCTRHW